MREIKFRAWDSEYKRMRPNPLIPDTSFLNDCFKDKRFKLMQYTGLKDSTKWDKLSKQDQTKWIEDGNSQEEWNGKKIYEGDVIDVGYDIVNGAGEESFDIEENILVEWNYEMLSNLSYADYIEIIGNKYENPELLEKI